VLLCPDEVAKDSALARDRCLEGAPVLWTRIRQAVDAQRRLAAGGWAAVVGRLRARAGQRTLRL
jgi:hypothetical protein